MDNPLTTRRPIDAWVDNPQTIEFAGKVADFPGLAEVLEKDLASVPRQQRPTEWRELPVSGHLALRSDGYANREVLLDGSISARLVNVCQRCLQPFEWSLETELSFRLVTESEGVDDDPSGREVWEIAGDVVVPQDIVEEAIVMAMPLAAMHRDSAECRRIDNDADARTEAQNLTRPFANLKSQMNESNRNKR